MTLLESPALSEPLSLQIGALAPLLSPSLPSSLGLVPVLWMRRPARHLWWLVSEWGPGQRWGSLPSWEAVQGQAYRVVQTVCPGEGGWPCVNSAAGGGRAGQWAGCNGQDAGLVEQEVRLDGRGGWGGAGQWGDHELRAAWRWASEMELWPPAVFLWSPTSWVLGPAYK